ncbi:ATP-binding protein [Sphaerimonospora thailandensis]|uniref:ATP-binding protein n=1 Tax=Sphaerimonospora thailandensis TaxID=795644 RepID=A0A8J3W0T0_9ACTN|nr:ATP-binding protein [Sphaerimonospora thailandensis]GIH71086.1 ATP-binding protein [Sphaerimonospora thailandensis]
MQSTNPTRGQIQWSARDWCPPIGWWPENARDLLEPMPGRTGTRIGGSATFVLPPLAESVHSARSFAAGTLSGWHLTELLDAMELVVSELTTNALRHGLTLLGPGDRRDREVIRLSLIRHGHLVTCAITDPGAAVPVMRDPAPFEPGGLGLHIVESLSVRWGWSALAPRGKAVWAVLSAS